VNGKKKPAEAFQPSDGASRVCVQSTGTRKCPKTSLNLGYHVSEAECRHNQAASLTSAGELYSARSPLPIRIHRSHFTVACVSALIADKTSYTFKCVPPTAN